MCDSRGCEHCESEGVSCQELAGKHSKPLCVPARLRVVPNHIQHFSSCDSSQSRGEYCIWLGTTRNLAGTHSCFEVFTCQFITGDTLRPAVSVCVCVFAEVYLCCTALGLLYVLEFCIYACTYACEVAKTTPNLSSAS